MSTSHREPADEFADWLTAQLSGSNAPQDAQDTQADATSNGPRPDYSQGGSDDPLPLNSAAAFASVIHQIL